jgi:hypothetical protein
VRTSPSLRLLVSLTLVLAACRGQSGAETAPPPQPPARPLAPLAAQQVIVAPTHSLREVDALGWTARIPRSRDYLRSLDTIIEAELAARGLGRQWVYPAALVRAQKASPSYAIDPYSLAANPLRSPSVIAGTRLGDPLMSQLRTMVALQESARAVLVPVELRFEKDDKTGQGAAVLRLAVVDGRIGEVRWIGDVKSEPSPTFSTALLTSVAGKVADLITAP